MSQKACEELAVVKLLNPGPRLLELIRDHGGLIVERGYDEWCHSDQCLHLDHYPGQAWSRVRVPKLWTDIKAVIPDWPDETDSDDKPVLTIPCADDNKLATIIFESKGEHKAGFSYPLNYYGSPSE